ncbi:hypothetical protein BGX21_010527 [Mortierella sp. AD011]|nr:hypothetical protein BGX20_002553 [Mortierella sp. AD010]KAF9394007.1 hypothetical protein BGX21_010527 [Mortierella sp. AD011]
MPCGAPCDRLPCNKRCLKYLDCGHQCPSVCGEKCPPTVFCVECKDPETMNTIVDLIMQQTLSKVNVDEDPILVLACDHALTMTTLDGMMEMSNYYQESMDLKTGEITFTGKRDLPGEEVSQVSCHLCRKPIIGLCRYGRRVKYAQLSLRLKKHQVVQARLIKDALQKFEVAQVLIEEKQLEFLTAIKISDAKTDIKPPRDEQRSLGRFKDQSTWLPNADFSNISRVYHISKNQEKLWKWLIEQASDSYSMFRRIHEMASKSPSKQLFDATVSHLYRLKTGPSIDPSIGPDEQQASMSDEEYTRITETIQSCMLECGLPRDGHGGSSNVDSLHEMTNALILVLAQALEVLKIEGPSSGWYWFTEDLIQCAGIHVEILKELALNGKYDKKLAFARMSRMELLLRATQWIGMRVASEDELDAKLKRVDYLTEQFMMELKEIEEGCPLEIKDECVRRATLLEERMTIAAASARNPTCYHQVTTREKVQLFRAMSQELGGTGHWYRCPNGHTYVIGNCGGAMQQSTCYECGAPIGGSSHRLQTGNTADEEFEGFYRRQV